MIHLQMENILKFWHCKVSAAYGLQAISLFL